MVRGVKLKTPNVSYSIKEIKKFIKKLEGHPVQWDLNKHDGRKKRRYIEGEIIKTYNHIFTIKKNGSGVTTSYSYVDLYCSHIKILSLIDGENILNRLKKRGRRGF